MSTGDAVPALKKLSEHDVHDSEEYESAGEEYEEIEEEEIEEIEEYEEEEEEIDDEKEKDLDDDEDKKKPQFIPKSGYFYEHDDRTRGGEEEEEVITVENVEGSSEPVTTTVVKKKSTTEEPPKPPKKDRPLPDRWTHDKFDENEQTPKSTDELSTTYGYDIRGDDQAPRAMRRRRYGRGPNKYTRKWDEEEAYQTSRPQRGGPRGGFRDGDRGGSRGGFRDNRSYRNSAGGGGGDRNYNNSNNKNNYEEDFPELGGRRGGGGGDRSSINKDKDQVKEWPGPDRRRSSGSGGERPSNRPRGGGGKLCFNCQQEGHIRAECKNERVERERPPRSGGESGGGRGRGSGGGFGRRNEFTNRNRYNRDRDHDNKDNVENQSLNMRRSNRDQEPSSEKKSPRDHRDNQNERDRERERASIRPHDDNKRRSNTGTADSPSINKGIKNVNTQQEHKKEGVKISSKPPFTNTEYKASPLLSDTNTNVDSISNIQHQHQQQKPTPLFDEQITMKEQSRSQQGNENTGENNIVDVDEQQGLPQRVRKSQQPPPRTHQQQQQQQQQQQDESLNGLNAKPKRYSAQRQRGPLETNPTTQQQQNTSNIPQVPSGVSQQQQNISMGGVGVVPAVQTPITTYTQAQQGGYYDPQVVNYEGAPVYEGGGNPQGGNPQSISPSLYLHQSAYAQQPYPSPPTGQVQVQVGQPGYGHPADPYMIPTAPPPNQQAGNPIFAPPTYIQDPSLINYVPINQPGPPFPGPPPHHFVQQGYQNIQSYPQVNPPPPQESWINHQAGITYYNPQNQLQRIQIAGGGSVKSRPKQVLQLVDPKEQSQHHPMQQMQAQQEYYVHEVEFNPGYREYVNMNAEQQPLHNPELKEVAEQEQAEVGEVKDDQNQEDQVEIVPSAPPQSSLPPLQQQQKEQQQEPPAAVVEEKMNEEKETTEVPAAAVVVEKRVEIEIKEAIQPAAIEQEDDSSFDKSLSDEYSSASNSFTEEVKNKIDATEITTLEEKIEDISISSSAPAPVPEKESKQTEEKEQNEKECEISTTTSTTSVEQPETKVEDKSTTAIKEPADSEKTETEEKKE